MGRSVHPHIITPDSAMLGESYGIDIPRSLRFNTNNGGNQYLNKSSVWFLLFLARIIVFPGAFKAPKQQAVFICADPIFSK